MFRLDQKPKSDPAPIRIPAARESGHPAPSRKERSRPKAASWKAMLTVAGKFGELV